MPANLPTKLSAATVQLFAGDQPGPKGIVTGRTRQVLLRKANRWADAIEQLDGKSYDGIQITGSNGEDLT